jgi:hypothetical protein
MIKPKKKNSSINCQKVIDGMVKKAVDEMARKIDQDILDLMYKEQNRNEN